MKTKTTDTVGTESDKEEDLDRSRLQYQRAAEGNSSTSEDETDWNVTV